MQPEGSPPPGVRAGIGVFVSAVGVSASLTVLFLGMRSVMEIGGACADGGPFVPVRPCPGGVPLLMVAGVWLGLLFAAVYFWQSLSHGVPSLAGLLWPALFLSLGWNFLEFGLDPPGAEGVAWGWLVCAALFFAMGGVPLRFVLPRVARSFTGRGTPSAAREVLAGVRAAASSLRGIRRASVAASGWPTKLAPEDAPGSGAGIDLVSGLERLDSLHRSGALDDGEYEAAKRRLLGREGS